MGQTALYSETQPAAGVELMNIALIVNARGKICLVHDEPFENIPLWVKYRNLNKKLEILFDNGTTRELPNTVNEMLNSYLVKADKIALVRTEDKNPVEAWDTILLNDSYN
ncbi:MAG: hypothetical protein AB7G06_05415 [Bdellovibrionales bacterium]